MNSELLSGIAGLLVLGFFNFGIHLIIAVVVGGIIMVCIVVGDKKKK